MLNKKVKEIEEVLKRMPKEKTVEVEIQERSANDPHNAEGLIVDEIITTLTIYDKQELTPIQDFVTMDVRMNKKVFVCNDHDGHWPVPTASVVVARDKEEAKELFNVELSKRGLDIKGYSLREIDITKEQVEILSDGEY